MSASHSAEAPRPSSGSLLIPLAVLGCLAMAMMAGLFLYQLLLHPSSANRQAERTWVSGRGDDVNPCSQDSPCRTFAGAMHKTAQNGEINCLNPAGYGTVTITKSITINCAHTNGSIRPAGTNGVSINITNAADALKTVRLVGININGAGSGARSGVNGIGIFAAKSVYIENVLITDHSKAGIEDTRRSAGTLSIINTTTSNNAVAGIQVIPTAVVDAVLDNVQSMGNGQGFAIGNQVKALANRSVFSHNAAHGVASDPGGTLHVNGSIITNNQNGVQAVAGSTVRLSNNDIAFNGTAITGATRSFGNNRIAGNGNAGTAPTPVADSHDKGQQ